jgi:hypothetical protein
MAQMKIQLALQGGGARIVSLLGATGAIQQLRDEARKSKQAESHACDGDVRRRDRWCDDRCER